MHLRGLWARLFGLGAVACVVGALSPQAGWAEGARAVRAPKAALRPVSHQLSAGNRMVDPLTEQGQRAHGLYFNAPVQRRLGPKGIIRTLRSAGMDAAVLDFKDGEGRVSWDTKIPSLKAQRHLYFKDLPAMVAELKAAGVYTIARVVCFSDPYLPRNEPDRAVLDDRPGKQGKVWATWGKRNPWLDPYNTRNQDLIVEMAKEVEAQGVDEIQFDYIRFPVDRATRFARFPAKTDASRTQVLVGMLERVDEAIHIPIGADVFGVTAFRRGDRDGLGQVPEAWAAHVEVFTPMLYMDGMTSWRPSRGNPRAEHLIFAGIQNLRLRLGKGPVLRPFLQAFARGADYYNAGFIAEQIRGARDAGADGYLFWSPGSSYSMVQASMAGPAGGLMPFPLDRRLAYRRDTWGAPAQAKEASDEGAVSGDAAAAQAVPAAPAAGAAVDVTSQPSLPQQAQPTGPATDLR